MFFEKQKYFPVFPFSASREEVISVKNSVFLFETQVIVCLQYQEAYLHFVILNPCPWLYDSGI